MTRKFWTAAEIEVLRQMWPTHTCPEIHQVLPNRSCGSIYEMCYRLGLQKDPEWNRLRREREIENLRKAGIKHRFKKGQVAHNKGEKGKTGTHPNTKKNWFKKGHGSQPAPIGTERVNPEGYRERKIADNRYVSARFNWKFVHRLLWEEHNGPIPRGHSVTFRNGDKTDIRIENLELVTRAELMNRNSVQNYPENVRAAVHAASRLSRVINSRMGKSRD